MANLLSPGVGVTVIDETFNVGSNPGTVPLIVIATQENKTLPDGTGVASGTLKSSANKLIPVTSQREALQLFGNPVFNSVGGTAVNGDPTNEYGLLAMHSYLGISNLVYTLRADVDLAQLQPSVVEPTTPAAPGTYWLDLAETKFGLFKYNSAYVSESIDKVFLAQDVSAIVPGLTETEAVGYASGALTYFYHQTIPGSPAVELWSSALPGYQANAVWPSTGTNGNYWLKTTASANGAFYAIKRKSATTGLWEKVDCPVLADDAAANSYYGTGLKLGQVYGDYSTSNAVVTFKILTSVAPATWTVMSDLVASYTPPTSGPVNGQLWFNPDLGISNTGVATVDLLVNSNTGKWINANLPGYHYSLAGAALPSFVDTAPVVYLQSFNPIDGSVFPHVSGMLSTGDIWVDTSKVTTYPVIYRFKAGAWVLVDNTDQSTPDAILFADARPNPTFVADVGAPVKQDAPDLDPDAPDADAYAVGTILWNTRYSTRNVKKYYSNYTFQGVVIGARWVSESGNKVDGSPYMGSAAQKAVIARQINAALNDNEDIRSENIYFNLVATPGFPEADMAMVGLSVDRKETVFVLGDTPMDLSSSSANLLNWASNANSAAATGEVGLVNSYTYASFNYPGAAYTTNVDGTSVVVPSTHAALRTYAYNDQVSYPWFAPAGETRGVVNNASSVGFINSEGEFVTSKLSNATRDILYVNGVNPIAQFPGQAPMFYGQKTRHPQESALDRVNVARLVIYVRVMLDRIARRFLFEFNDSITRSAFKEAVDRFLAELITLRALSDAASVCDESNNFPSRIDRNEMWMDVAIAPNRVAEFIYIPIRLRNTGTL